MIRGYFENCYGLKEFTLPNIDFTNSNRAIIYAPNGVMKSSLSKVFDDISKGNRTTDRIFTGVISSYSINYYAGAYNYSSENDNTLGPTENIYVINPFSDTFEFTKETVSTLLADETTRNEYNVLISQISGDIRQIERKLKILTGLKNQEIKTKLIQDLHLSTTSDWTDIFERLKTLFIDHNHIDALDGIKYAELLDPKVIHIYSNPEFIRSINDYVNSLDQLLENNPVLCRDFNDSNAESFGKDLEKNNLFNANHTIHLKDGVTVIHSLDEWKAQVKEQLDRIYEAPELSTVFSNLKQLLTKNTAAQRVRDIIISNREIIPLLRNIDNLKIELWLNSFSFLDESFEDYYIRISRHTDRIRQLYERASEQSARWTSVVNEFNRRFRVPFKVIINNKANFLLKDEAPNLSFEYKRGQQHIQSAILKKDDLMVSLSTGEKRALYLLYVLFDLERIRKMAEAGGKYLIVADDIADSFDYKNKYAIIEYLSDLANSIGIDLLVLTHNFDFYRTVKFRLSVNRNHCLIAQRDEEGKVSISEFKYQKDFFKNVVINQINNGDISTDEKIKLLISSIPFYRNLCEYCGKDMEYNKLTAFMHLKTTPLNTETVTLSDLWSIINQFLSGNAYNGTNEKFIDALIRIANSCVTNTADEVLLENKLVIAIAIRLKAEIFLRDIIVTQTGTCVDATSNQTREWYNNAKTFLTDEQKRVIDDVFLITPENIHLNSFMYEPLIDISDWTLKELFQRVDSL